MFLRKEIKGTYKYNAARRNRKQVAAAQKQGTKLATLTFG
jgi:hypothetical protein